MALAIHPIHDKDSQSAKSKGELGKRHLCERVEQELCIRMIINHTIPSLNVAWLGIELGGMIYGLKDETVPQR